MRPYTALALVITGLLGCGAAAFAGPRAGRAPARPQQAPTRKAAAPVPDTPKVLLPPVENTWIRTLTPLESGFGVLIGEPAPVDADQATAEFGAGCGRWLHLIVGGHGELGKTPRWCDLPVIWDELKKSSLRLTPADLPTLSRRPGANLGVTHVALGEIRGRAENTTLTYRLWELSSQKTVGEPITVSGSLTEILAGLPKVATSLCTALQIASPRVPSRVGETAEEMTALGSLAPIPAQGSKSLPWEKLSQMAMRIYGSGGSGGSGAPVLAAFDWMLIQGGQQDPGQVLSLGKALLRALPDNVMAYTEAVTQAAMTLRAKPSDMPLTELKQHLARFPNNHLLRAAEAYSLHAGNQLEEARKSAEILVRGSMHDPTAWLFLNNIIQMQAEFVRRSRFIGAMTQKELDYCMERYQEQLPVVSRAVQLDPQMFAAWFALSESATFNGDAKLADGAYWKAQALEPNNAQVYQWGLQIYQPKWFDDAVKLARVARLAAEAAKDWDSATRVWVALAVHQAGLPNLATPVVRTETERAALKQQIEEYDKLQQGAR